MNIPAIIGIVALASSPGAIYGIYHLSHSSVKQDIQKPTIKEETKSVEAAPVLPSPQKPAVPVEIPKKQQPKTTLPSFPPEIVYDSFMVPKDDILRGLREEAIGNKYKDFLLGDRKSSEWNRKLNDWQKTYKDPTHKQNLTKAFTPKSPKELTMDKLHTKCRRAYEKTSWSEGIDGHQKEQYWAMVKALCGNGKEMPDGWGSRN